MEETREKHEGREVIMANEQNLRPGEYKLSVEQAKKGGKASAKARAAKRDLRQALEMLLDRKFTDKDGNQITGTEAITAKLFQQAMKGNIRAFETLRDTVGQKPVEKIMLAEVDQNVIDEVEKVVLSESPTGT